VLLSQEEKSGQKAIEALKILDKNQLIKDGMQQHFAANEVELQSS
jgi:hypothetical protein